MYFSVDNKLDGKVVIIGWSLTNFCNQSIKKSFYITYGFSEAELICGFVCYYIFDIETKRKKKTAKAAWQSFFMKSHYICAIHRYAHVFICNMAKFQNISRRIYSSHLTTSKCWIFIPQGPPREKHILNTATLYKSQMRPATDYCWHECGTCHCGTHRLAGGRPKVNHPSD